MFNTSVMIRSQNPYANLKYRDYHVGSTTKCRQYYGQRGPNAEQRRLERSHQAGLRRLGEVPQICRWTL
jgi:hypothetical protein